MDYAIYKGIRGAAWQCLIDCEVQSLPVPLGTICRHYGAQVKYNSEAQQLNNGESGKLMIIHDKPYIIVDDRHSKQRMRFTVAHELGHFLLGHCGDHVHEINREYARIKPEQEQEADMFAARLLAPACVLWALDLHTPEEISKCCQISYTAAKFRAERMQILYARQKFLTSPIERKVFEAFRPWIDEQKNRPD